MGIWVVYNIWLLQNKMYNRFCEIGSNSSKGKGTREGKGRKGKENNDKRMVQLK